MDRRCENLLLSRRNFLGGARLERWFNTGAGFERDSRFQLEQNVRTFPSLLTGVRAPGDSFWNLSAVKEFRIVEPLRFELRTLWKTRSTRPNLRRLIRRRSIARSG